MRRYVDWIDRNRWLVLGAGLALAVAGGALAIRLPIRSELADLLPPGRRSVRDLDGLQQRARAFGTIFVIVEADTPAVRDRATQDLVARLQRIEPALLARVEADDDAARAYFWNQRFLFADLGDLEQARQAIRDRIDQATLRANPLYLDLDDPASTDDPGLDDRVAGLRRRLDQAEASMRSSQALVSRDQRMRLVILSASVPASNVDAGRELLARVNTAIAETRRAVPEVHGIEVTGNTVSNVYEHDSIMRGMQLAAVVTVVLCALALLLYYRSASAVMAALVALAVGTLATFGVAWLAIGYLNVMTAFLVAIVVGNGINASLILLARYLEEFRAGRPGNDGLAAAIAATARGTFAGAIAASVAYGSLLVTEFRGFRHFGVIGGIGMVLCWASAFTVLPAALCVLRRRGLLRRSRPPRLGAVLARLLPSRLWVTAAIGGGLAAAAIVISVRFIASGPIEKDWRGLRPTSADLRRTNVVGHRMGEQFDPRLKAGQSQRFIVAVNDRKDVAPLVARLRRADPDLIASVTSLDDLIPRDQDEKLAVLADIRRLLDQSMAELDPDDRKLLDRVRPPAVLRRLGDADVPDELAWRFVEKDGSRGRLVLVTGSSRFDPWNIDDRLEFVAGVRDIGLPPDVLVGGESFVIADIIASVERDGPLASLVSAVGAALAVVLIMGLGRHALVVFVCGLVGITGMVALCALAGLKVHFLDIIALPITIGIGIEYAVNLAARDREPGGHGPRHLLATTGGAVLLCSYTTTVGYGSLLLSDTGGIRAFGLAAIFGELSCVVAALFLVPTALALLGRSPR